MGTEPCRPRATVDPHELPQSHSARMAFTVRFHAASGTGLGASKAPKIGRNKASNMSTELVPMNSPTQRAKGGLLHTEIITELKVANLSLPRGYRMVLYCHVDHFVWGVSTLHA